MSKVGLTFRWLVVPLSFIAFNPSTMAINNCGGLGVDWNLSSCKNGGVDTTASLGQFYLQLTKAGGNLLGIPDCPGNSACIIKSPVLFDGNTKIGRSRPITEVEQDVAEVCITGTETSCTWPGKIVKDSQLIFPVPLPGEEGFVEGPNGIQEIHTRINYLNMTDGGGFAVRAGDEPAPAQKPSIGEVESRDGIGFFAESFFDVYVEIDATLPVLGKRILFNKVPLIIQNSYLESFPPEVVYIHRGSNQVGVFFRAPDPLSGEPFAGILIAGHGLKPELTNLQLVSNSDGEKKLCPLPMSGTSSLDSSSEECISFSPIATEFADFIATQPEIPLPLSVNLNSLTATVQGNEVTLNFVTASEKDVLGLQLWRGKPLNGECTADLLNYVNPNMVGEINSVGSETTGATYQMTDSVAAGTYCYALKEVNENGDAVWIESHIAKAVVN